MADATAQGASYLMNDFSSLYTQPHFRMATMFTGVLAGFLLHEVRVQHLTQKSNNARLAMSLKIIRNPVVTGLAFVAAIQPYMMALYLPEIQQVVPLEDRADSFESVNVANRLLWSISNAIIMIRMCTDWQHTAIMRLASSNFWEILVKLDYLILLIHLDVIEMNLWSQTYGRLFTKSRAFFDFLAYYSICLPVAFLLYVVVENPLDKLLKEILL